MKYQDLRNGRFYLGDNVEVMRSIPEGVIDLTVTSPPYDNMREYTGESEWNWEKFTQVAQELYRVTKEGGVVVWNVNDKTVNGAKSCSSFKQVLHFCEVGFILADTMIWEKTGTSMGSNRLYHANFEYMFILSKGKHITFNPIRDRKNVVKGKQSVGGGGIDVHGKSKPIVSIVSDEFGKRNNIWRINPAQGVNKHGHPAPFPEIFARDHIISWSNEDDVVLDPFMGSGTTACAAIETNRKWVGIEVSQEYADKAIERISKYGTAQA